MSDYDMGGGGPVEDGSYGFGPSATLYGSLQVVFQNVNFSAVGGQFVFTGFDLITPPIGNPGSIYFDICSGFPGVGAQVSVTVTCSSSSTPSFVLSDTPYFLNFHAGSIGRITPTEPELDDIEISGLPGRISAVPEPSTLALAGMSLGLVSLLRRRKVKAGPVRG
jgi:hypothetical protein